MSLSADFTGHEGVGDPHCPRCGYELRGSVAAWLETCPLEGACSECGLGFEWGDLYRPERFAPQWCVEFARTWGRVPLATLTTCARSLWPWRFWQSVKMSHPIRWRRLIAYIALLLAPLVAMYIALQTTAAIMVLRRQQQQIVASQAAIPGMLQSLPTLIRPPPWWMDMLPSLAITARHRQQQTINDAATRLQQMQRTPPVIRMSYPRAIYEALLFPLSNESAGTVQYPAFDSSGYTGQATHAYVPPRDLHAVLFAANTPGRPVIHHDLWNAITASAAGIGFWTLALGFMPLTLAFLPVSRRRAKVRWSHIGRIAAYSLAVPCVLLYLSLALVAIAAVLGPSSSVSAFARGGLILTTAACIPLALACWWWAAIKHHLRIPHSLATVALLGVLSALLVIAAIFYIGVAVQYLSH